MKWVAATEPNFTDVTPENLDPRILTLVPPLPGPLVRDREVMAGRLSTMVQVKLVDPVLAGTALSVAVTVTEEVPGVVGVPAMVPLEAPIDRPAGSPDADQVMVGAGERCESVAVAVTGVIATPVVPFWLAMGATETVFLMVQVKVAEPEKPLLSVTVMVTE